jgi:flagellar motor switch protein FliN/FliY
MPEIPEGPTLALLLDVSVPVQISFGRARIRLGNLLALGPGSVVELDRAAGDEVEILVNDRVIARGEVVEYEGNYGVRVHSLEGGAVLAKNGAPAAPGVTEA